MPAPLETLLAALGTGPAGHAVLSRGGVPLLLLPRDRAVASAALGLYRPQSLKARAAALAVRLALSSGPAGRLVPRLPGRSDATGVLVCNPVHGTRVVAVRRGPGGGLEVVKAALAADAAPLRAELAALVRLSGLPGVPRAAGVDAGSGVFAFSTPFLPRGAGGRPPAALLRAWERGPEEPAERNGLVRDLAPLLGAGDRERLAGLTVRRAVVHGDFAPWNWRRDAAGGFSCVDWEWARDDGFAGFDMAYAAVQRLLLVEKVRPDRLEARFLRAVSRLGAGERAVVEGCGIPADLLLRLVLAYRATKGMGGASAAASVPRFVAFEGADGVGKSTVMRAAVPELVRRGGFAGYAFFHWKPVRGGVFRGSFPPDDPHDPRRKGPRNGPASLVFLFRHWLGFQAGWWLRVRPALRSGLLVVADRYSYDVFADPARFRLRLPDAVLRAFVRTVPRPDAAVLLHAPPSAVRARKPELSEREIGAYQRRLLSFSLVRSPFPVDASGTPESVVRAVLANLAP